MTVGCVHKTSDIEKRTGEKDVEAPIVQGLLKEEGCGAIVRKDRRLKRGCLEDGEDMGVFVGDRRAAGTEGETENKRVAVRKGTTPSRK